MDAFVVIIAFLAWFVGAVWGVSVSKPENNGMACTQSSIVNGKAECVEYRRAEK